MDNTILDWGKKYLFDLVLEDRLLLFIVVCTLVFFLLSLVFAFFILIQRYLNIRLHQRWKNLVGKWEEEIVLVLSGEHEASILLDRVRKRERLYFLDFLTRYAQRFIGEERILITQLAQPFLPLLMRRVKKGDAEQRARAVRTLSILDHQGYQEAIVQALEDSSPMVAMIAMQSLLRERPDRVQLEAILHNLHRFENWSSTSLATLLANVGSSAIPSLQEAYSNPSTPQRVRAVAAEALRELHDFSAADLAEEILQSETNRDLLASSLRLLADVGQPKHIDVIRKLCMSEDDVVRAQAVRSLGNFGDVQDVETLRLMINDPSTWVAYYAALSLKKLGESGVLEEIASSEHPRRDMAQQVLTEANWV